MSKKSHKVEEAQAAYAAKKPRQPAPAASSQAPGPRLAGAGEIRESNARLLVVHQDVLQKLAR